MAFRSAQSARIYIGLLAAAAYTRNVSAQSGTEMVDVTTLADTARAMIPGRDMSTFTADGPLDVDASTNGQFDALAAQKGVTTHTPITYLPLGAAAADDESVWLIEAIETQLDTTATAAGGVDWTFAATTNGETDFNGFVLEDNTTVTTDTDGTAHTGPAGGTTNGAVAHLHVTAFSGFTSDDIIIEGSTSGAFGGEETTIFTFTQVTDVTSERVEVTGTVPRYLRVVDDVTGVGSITHFVAVSRR